MCWPSHRRLYRFGPGEHRGITSWEVDGRRVCKAIAEHWRRQFASGAQVGARPPVANIVGPWTGSPRPRKDRFSEDFVQGFYVLDQEMRFLDQLPFVPLGNRGLVELRVI